MPITCENDPVRVAWKCLGATEEVGEFGHCGRCGFMGLCVPVGQVVSVNFTGWDSLRRDADALCSACAWAYREPQVRLAPLVVSDNRAEFVGKGGLAPVLSGPLDRDVCVTVPDGRRKHLLPSAEWGCVATDAGTFEWTAGASRLLRAVMMLRDSGVGESAMSRDSLPPSAVMSGTADAVLRAWKTMQEWRSSPHLRVAVIASRGVA